MTRRIRYTDEFKREAVAQVTDRGYSVKDVAGRLGVCTKSIYDWMKRYGPAEPERKRPVNPPLFFRALASHPCKSTFQGNSSSSRLIL